MSAINRTWMILGSLLVSALGQATEVGPSDPLFQSTEAIDVRIIAPLTTLTDERPESELPGTFEFSTADESKVFDIQIEARGRFRRRAEICEFPPLRLNFRKSQTKDTLFHKQDKVKLVTHCNDDSTYREVLLREYMTYRVLSVLSEASFGVRLLNITYVDSEDDGESVEQYGFIIEHRDRLAKRLGMSVVEATRTTRDRLHQDHMALMTVFHYMIGNTDFSPVIGNKDDYCCHNHVLFGNVDEPYWSVPYDFDQSGLVDAPHAAPNPRFRLRDVRERRFRGRCVDNHLLENALGAYHAKRDVIYALIENDVYLGRSSKRAMLKYLDSFYRTLNSEKRLQQQIFDSCEGRSAS